MYGCPMAAYSFWTVASPPGTSSLVSVEMARSLNAATVACLPTGALSCEDSREVRTMCLILSVLAAGGLAAAGTNPIPWPNEMLVAVSDESFAAAWAIWPVTYCEIFVGGGLSWLCCLGCSWYEA